MRYMIFMPPTSIAIHPVGCDQGICWNFNVEAAMMRGWNPESHRQFLTFLYRTGFGQLCRRGEQSRKRALLWNFGKLGWMRSGDG
ncbi:MAG: hypothetical protein ACLSA6_04130 [Holdemania massiliensis]